MAGEIRKTDFEEITLAITLLASLSVVLLKIVDYFNNNIINISHYFQVTVQGIVLILLIDILIIFLFLMMKGYLISIKNRNRNLISFTKFLFGASFVLSIVLFIALIMMLFFFQSFGTTSDKNPYYIYILIVCFILVLLIVVIIGSWLTINAIKDWSFEPEKKSKAYYFTISISFILIIFIFMLLSVGSSYLLMGSYSMDVFPQSNADNDILTFTIKETGLPYNFSNITLFKLNSGSKFKQYVDNITINRTNESLSNNSFMLGEIYDGTWYLNINTSNLQSGTYLLHAEVTDKPSSRFLGVTQKRADKLFYIPPKA
jgi:hypothetical protein